MSRLFSSLSLIFINNKTNTQKKLFVISTYQSLSIHPFILPQYKHFLIYGFTSPHYITLSDHVITSSHLIISSHTTYHHITSYHIISHHIISSHHITSHHHISPHHRGVCTPSSRAAASCSAISAQSHSQRNWEDLGFWLSRNCKLIITSNWTSSSSRSTRRWKFRKHLQTEK